jgi:hypothetical protein
MTEISSPPFGSNIEPFARTVCERELRHAGVSGADLSACIDRYWHCVAAQIESGLRDDDGKVMPHDFESGLVAYRDWRTRHPN